ncbi:protein bcp1 [Geopyxis carbonaria]|nr:protein bcp1 [Geopyxis carbonaria]
MPKRSAGEDDDVTMASASEAEAQQPKTTKNADADSDSDSEDVDMVNVEFELFDPQPAHDFHGLRTLLRQLFDVDAPLFDLSALTDLILSQPLLGSTVKTDGNQGDPYAFLTVLNLTTHAETPCVKTLREYLVAKAKGNAAVQSVLKDANAQVGLILTERVVNMPVEVVPPMYKMLLEEVQWAVDDGEEYKFTHWLVLTKTYAEVVSKLDEMESRPKKRGKPAKRSKSEVFYYHAEDEAVRQVLEATNCVDFKFSKEGDSADSKRAFSDMGIKPQGLMMLLDKPKLEEIVGVLEGLFKP